VANLVADIDAQIDHGRLSLPVWLVAVVVHRVAAAVA
jgi:hypothetical protein